MAERRSRVQGARQIKQRSEWPYPIDQYEWTGDLNFIRQQLGDRQVSILLGYSLSDPSYKSVRRLAAGTRLPNGERYSLIVAKAKELRGRLDVRFVEVAAEAYGLLTKDAILKSKNKIALFSRLVRPFNYRRDPPEGWVPEPDNQEVYDGIYTQCCDQSGNHQPPSSAAAGLVVVHRYVSHDNGATWELDNTEVGFLWREDTPSPGLVRNWIDTWLNRLPRNLNYKAFQVMGVWWSYATSKR